MNIQIIAEHSVDLDILSGGICIDAGCRGFQFSEAMRDLGCAVFAYDIEQMAVPPGIAFWRKAVSNWTGKGYFKDTSDAQAKHLSDGGTPVNIISINDIFYDIDKKGFEVDVLKLDVEGSEYHILSDPDFRIRAKQISVEFHMHAHRALHEQYYDKCMENLLKWYEPVKHEMTQAHGAGLNYWDSLFVRRDLIQ